MTDLQRRYALLHGSDREAARAELRRVREAAAARGAGVAIVSACLLGVRCRYDGGDTRDDVAVARLGEAELLPLCPEVLAGFGVPRPAINVTSDGAGAIDARGRDVTETLDSGVRLADRFAEDAGATRALLKERSPSCGVHRVHGPDGIMPGQGRFAARLGRRGLPLASEEG